MSAPKDTKRVPHLGTFRLDGWSVRQDEGTLCCEDRVIRLEPRVMDVLVYLAAVPGTVVPKEELLEVVWGGSFVEEGALAQAIHSLRKALGDDARQPRFIQTIPKRGYRLVAAVVPEAAGPEPVMPTLPREEGTVPAPSRWRAWLLAGITVLAVVVVLGLTRARLNRSQQVEETPAPPAPEGRRIVVLPFENLNEPQDAYFARGLTEEITKDLASLPALEVISRTSAMQYEKAHEPLPQIARELKVDYVLEGTVQWNMGSPAGPQVRITPRLVRAADDTQVWVGGFDKEVKDIFTVQSEISRQVITQLGIALTPEEGRAMRAPPTSNLEAYQSYLRGLELRDQPFFSPEHIHKAVAMFERATELDPRFASAWAELSQTHCYLAFTADRSPTRVEAAKKAMDRAVALDPGLPSVWLARVYFSYRCEEDYDAALTQLNAAVQRFPNNAEVLQTLGFVLRRKGRLREAAEVLQHAFTLDPKTVMLVCETGETYRALRNYKMADRFYAQAISLTPDEPFYWEGRVLNRFAWTGDFAEAREILAKSPIPTDQGLLAVSFKLDFYARDYHSALSRLSPEKMHGLSALDRSLLLTWAAIVRERMGDHQGALAAAQANRAELEQQVRLSPKEPYFPALQAIALAQLGRSAEASALAEKTARENYRDAYAGPNVVEFQAMTETILGRHHEAVDLLARLLASCYRSAISVNDLRLNPFWDPLRGDRKFEDLLRRFQ